MNLRVFVASHKKYWIPRDKMYVPLHVGKEGKEDIGYIGDNTGDNISSKNGNYCELTGLYWIWKNISCEYVGLCHYRRYFAKKNFAYFFRGKHYAILNCKQVEEYLKNYDIILPKKTSVEGDNVLSQYAKNHKEKDIEECEKIIKQFYPEYVCDFEEVMSSRHMYFFNMFITSKRLIDEYCCWLFEILFELEKRIDIGDYDCYQARIYGFLAERLFNVWLHHKCLKIKEVKVISIENDIV